MYKFKLLFSGFKIYFYSVLLYSANRFIALLIKHNKKLSSFSVIHSARFRERLLYKNEKTKKEYAKLLMRVIIDNGYYN